MGVKTVLRSEEIFAKSKEVIPGGVNSPVRAFHGLGVSPLVVEKGKGDTITDVNGKSYVDYCMSWGALLHGHALPKVVERVQKRVANGSSFGIATEIEERLARKITEKVTSIEKLRFVSSGTEATMTAVRLARGFTGRSLVIKFNGNYHGHSDGFLIEAGSGVAQAHPTSSSKGVPEEVLKGTLSLPYNDVEMFKEAVRMHGNSLAAVIVEPIAANMGVVPAQESFLSALRRETERVGALLIFDEVISGFRVGEGGAEAVYGVRPDLSCLGKIVGGGFPAAVCGGRGDVMDHLTPLGGVYQAGTLSGNPVAMEAGLVTLEEAEKEAFYKELQEKTESITKPIKTALVEKGLPACVQESIGMFTLFWGVKEVCSFECLKELDKERFNAYFRFMLEEGIYLSPSPYEACFISSAHTEANLEKTRDLIIRFIRQC